MKNKDIIIGLAVVLLAMLTAAYWNHFGNGFHFDDSHAIVDNIYIRNIQNIPAFFSHPEMFSSSPAHWGMRPLVTTTLAIDYWLGGGLDPFYFQLSTFIWHILLCVLLFFMYRHFLRESFAHQWTGYFALFMVGWYALHTANAETINYVISRSDVLSTFCITASFLMYISLPDLRKRYLYIIPALIGVFAKETVLVLVIVLFFYIILFERKLSIAQLFKTRNLKLVGRTIVELLPLLLMVLIAQVYTLSKISSIPGITNPPGEYLLTQSYVWLRYFIAFFLPLNLSADTDWTVIRNPFDERVIIGLLFVVLLVVTIFKTSVRPETKPIAFGLIWFAAALLPTSLAPFAEVTNDHRMYFPFIGLVLSVVSTIALWIRKKENSNAERKFLPGIVVIAAFAVLFLNAYGVYERNKIWKDDESLWLDVTIKSPNNGRGLMNYGLTQMAKGNYAVAGTYFDKALHYLPYYSTLYINIGVLKNAVNEPQLAEANFKKAITLAPAAFDSYAFYARFLNERNRLDEARLVAEKALQLHANSVMTLNILMSVYNKLGLWNELRETASRVLSLLPDDKTALAFLDAAAKKQALTEGPQPVAKKQLTAADYLNESLMHYNQKNYMESIAACKKALELNPDYANAYSNIGAAYNQLKQWDKGIEACKKALEIDPGHPLAKGNLKWAQSHMRN